MEADDNKRMIFADIDVLDGSRVVGRLTPAKFIYRKQPEAPTSEVAISHGFREDIYVVVGTISPDHNNIATFQIHVNPLVAWIWIGCIVLILGSVVCLWPTVAPEESRAWVGVRMLAGVGVSCLLGVMVAATSISSLSFANAARAEFSDAQGALPSVPVR